MLSRLSGEGHEPGVMYQMAPSVSHVISLVPCLAHGWRQGVDSSQCLSAFPIKSGLVGDGDGAGAGSHLGSPKDRGVTSGPMVGEVASWLLHAVCRTGTTRGIRKLDDSSLSRLLELSSRTLGHDGGCCGGVVCRVDNVNWHGDHLQGFS